MMVFINKPASAKQAKCTEGTSMFSDSGAEASQQNGLGLAETGPGLVSRLLSTLSG